MNFELNEQQLSIQKMARDFTEKKVAPKVLERDETREYDRSLYEDLCSMGFIGLPYEKEYGGEGLGYMEYALAIEEISKVDPLPVRVLLRGNLSVRRQPALLQGHR